MTSWSAENSRVKIEYESDVDHNIFGLDFTEQDLECFTKVRRFLVTDQFSKAIAEVQNIKDAIYKHIVQTYVLAEGFKRISILDYNNFKNLIQFNIEHDYLPTFKVFHDKIERYYIKNTTVLYEDIEAYFKKFQPKKIATIIKFLKHEEDAILSAHTTKNETIKKLSKLEEKVIKIWLKYAFEKEELITYYNSFYTKLSQSNIIEKAETLVFGKQYKQLKELAEHIQNEEYKNLFLSILEIDQNPQNINNILRKIPKNLKNNEALNFIILKYYRKHNNDKAVLKILFNLKNSSKYGDYWWLYRHIYVKKLMADKEYKKAYYIAATHNSHKMEAEWLAGWLALRFLKKPTVALEHFRKFSNNVNLTNNKAKAYYWLASAYHASGNQNQAIYWYSKAADFALTFYGQIAKNNLANILQNDDYKIVLPQLPPVENEDKIRAKNNLVIRYAYFYLKYLKERTKASDLFKLAIFQSTSNSELVAILQIVDLFKDVSFANAMAENIKNKGVFSVKHLYPILKNINNDSLDYPLVHALIKQESNFTQTSVSPAGALGLMQIMPFTAKALCKELKITYNELKLRKDAYYNVALGNYYIQRLIKTFSGSKILAMAAYNAGTRNVMRWIREYGDVRKYTNVDDVVDWIEQIDFGETRGYLQQVLANLVIYDNLFETRSNKE